MTLLILLTYYQIYGLQGLLYNAKRKNSIKQN